MHEGQRSQHKTRPQRTTARQPQRRANPTWMHTPNPSLPKQASSKSRHAPYSCHARKDARAKFPVHTGETLKSSRHGGQASQSCHARYGWQMYSRAESKQGLHPAPKQAQSTPTADRRAATTRGPTQTTAQSRMVSISDKGKKAKRPQATRPTTATGGKTNPEAAWSSAATRAKTATQSNKADSNKRDKRPRQHGQQQQDGQKSTLGSKVAKGE